MKKRILAAFGAIIFACSLPLTEASAASTKQFSDVPASKYFAEAVYDLAERNILGGYPDGTFKPGNSITRGQAAAIIAKMVKLDTANVKDPKFKDVSTANGYYKAIAALAEQGIINGYGDGRYGPNDPIKRGQMASILVKAFDLPRYDYNSNEILFKDVNYTSHGLNIFIIYKLGITTGTTPNTFSPNAFITRGQAAKMLKATEEAKPKMVTLEASELGFDQISRIEADAIDSHFYEGLLVKGKYLPTGYSGDLIQLIPLKEGTSTLVISGVKDGSELYKKYYVHMKKENGKLELALEQTEDSLPTVATLWFYENSMNEPLNDTVQNISLETMEGENLSDNVAFEQCGTNGGCIVIDNPGQYIATVRFTGGKFVRYGIEAKPNKSSIYYDIRTLKEQRETVFKFKENFDIGKHIIQTKDAEQIAIVTRDPGTNVFRAKATGENGYISVDFEKTVTERECFSENECVNNVWLGVTVNVGHIGSIVNVTINRNLMPNY
ncbi:S-layer homology domain-containing protein [Solibacillus sp. FSL R5-0691]|uniref:S-layer homology domain-containing protein n=1 Tax=Solibacillus sp. FSL R5-0691 TaxID=2921653 RepID=UPI0030CB0BC7